MQVLPFIFMVHEKQTHGVRGKPGRRGSGKIPEGWMVSRKRAGWQRPGTTVVNSKPWWAVVAHLGTASKRPPSF